MARLVFEKVGRAVWISHLDLMRLFQRAFKRAALPLKHSQGYNPRPSVSIALPLSVGVESVCELLDFELEGELPPMIEIKNRLNAALVEGIRVLDVYHDGKKLKELALLSCQILLKYDHGVDVQAVSSIRELFSKTSVVVEKKSKNGPVEQDIIPMIRSLTVENTEQGILISAVICCQNPSLNPIQIAAAVKKYLPQYAFDDVKYRRNELFTSGEVIFR